jgi:hypothetical protein
VLGLTALGWLEWYTSGGFIRHIVVYNVNRFWLGLMTGHLLEQKPYAPLFLVAAAGLAFLWWKHRHNESTCAQPSATPGFAIKIITLWFILATGMLATVGKVGSSTNYFIDLMSLSTIPVGVLVAFGWQAGLDGGSGRSFTRMRLVGVFLAVGLIAQVGLRRHDHYSAIDDLQLTKARQSLVEAIAHQTHPVLSEDMVLLMRAGQEVPIEPAIFVDLSAEAIWDQTPFLESLLDRSFAFIITQRQDLYTPEMLAAIAQAYPIAEKLGPYIIHRSVATSSGAPTLPQH